MILAKILEHLCGGDLGELKKLFLTFGDDTGEKFIAAVTPVFKGPAQGDYGKLAAFVDSAGGAAALARIIEECGGDIVEVRLLVGIRGMSPLDAALFCLERKFPVERKLALAERALRTGSAAQHIKLVQAVLASDIPRPDRFVSNTLPDFFAVGPSIPEVLTLRDLLVIGSDRAAVVVGALKSGCLRSAADYIAVTHTDVGATKGVKDAIDKVISATVKHFLGLSPTGPELEALLLHELLHPGAAEALMRERLRLLTDPRPSDFRRLKAMKCYQGDDVILCEKQLLLAMDQGADDFASAMESELKIVTAKVTLTKADVLPSCPVCFGDAPFDDIAVYGCCGKMACGDCARHMLKNEERCFDMGCRSLLDIDSLVALGLDKKQGTLKKMTRFINSTGGKWSACVNPGCSGGSTDVGPSVICRMCADEYCRDCMVQHPGMNCLQYNQMAPTTYPIGSDIQACPNCKALCSFDDPEGCDIVKCGNCQGQFNFYDPTIKDGVHSYLMKEHLKRV
jgi:hypothetical protein